MDVDGLSGERRRALFMCTKKVLNRFIQLKNVAFKFLLSVENI